MLLLRTESLPYGEQWLYELKLDGCSQPAVAEQQRLQRPVSRGRWSAREASGEHRDRRWGRRIRPRRPSVFQRFAELRFIGLREDKNARDDVRDW